MVDQPVEAAAVGIGGEKVIAPVPVKNPLLWINETPNVHDVLVELVQNGKVLETRRVDLGFRKVEVKGQAVFH